MTWRRATLGALVCVTTIACMRPAVGHGPDHRRPVERRLPVIGRAPDFALLSQDGQPISLRRFRGKVVVVSFLYTSCSDICPILVARLVDLHQQFTERGGRNLAFVLITIDPERDTPTVLKNYAARQGATDRSWYFLTGEATAIRATTRQYGVVVRHAGDGDFDHTVLTSLVDRDGTLRVQYLGIRFSADEFLRDLASLVAHR